MTSEASPRCVDAIELATRPKRDHICVVEVAKSGRSRCRKCKQCIQKGELRIGIVRFHPHRMCSWYHFGTCMRQCTQGLEAKDLKGLKDLEEGLILQIQNQFAKIYLRKTLPLPTYTGPLDLARFATILTQRFGYYRSFRFGLPEHMKYGLNWNWRCFLATMLVCNTHESAMLRCTHALFKVYPDPESLDTLYDDKPTQKAWMDWMEKRDLRHVGRKMAYILRANRKILTQFGGRIPEDRETLQKMPGVGRHVASITLAWVHNKPEFGIDTHVSRILRRWNFVPPKAKDADIEQLVHNTIPSNLIGHFSRAFVDLGQSYCQFTPSCHTCFLRHSCPKNI